MVAAPVTAAPALQSSKNISPNIHPAATFLANLSPFPEDDTGQGLTDDDIPF